VRETFDPIESKYLDKFNCFRMRLSIFCTYFFLGFYFLNVLGELTKKKPLSSSHSFPLIAPSGSLYTFPCSSSPEQTWTIRSDGRLSSASKDGNLCATPSSTLPVPDGTLVTMQPCDISNPSQVFLHVLSNNTLVLANQPSVCLNIEDYSKSPASTVWLYTCNIGDCQGNCDWTFTSGPPGPLYQPESQMCLSDGTTTPPIKPRTCEIGSPSYNLPFCDYTLPFADRIEDLYSRFSFDEKLAIFSQPIAPTPYNASLNILSFYHDITCIQGLSPGIFNPTPNVTVFPNTISQAASMDLDLIARISQATALEGRIVNQINYRLTGGTTFQGVSCDGGPLANTAHDARWGRISETYGEDPFLASEMGRIATINLQQRTSEYLPGSSFIKTSQVTRHFIGYHGASDLPYDGEEYTLPQWLEDQQLNVYEALQRPEIDGGGGSEGIMCGYAAFASSGDIPPPRNNETWKAWIPSCVNAYIMQVKLRDEWRAESFVQTDCCGSIDAMLDHKYFDTLEEATVAAINMGVSAAYENHDGIQNALRAGLADGTLNPQLLDARLKRILLMRFRLGEFDSENPNNPFRGPFNESDLDGSIHRSLAREAAAKSIVLLENRGNVLPLVASSLPSTIAVMGAFSKCEVLFGDYGGHDKSDADDCTKAACSYGHSYSGSMSSVSNVLTALQEEVSASGDSSTSVFWTQGSQAVLPCGTEGITNATTLALKSDLIFLVVGLGSEIEVEGNDRRYVSLPPPQDELLRNVSATVGSAKIVLIIFSAGPVAIDPTLADTILWVGYTGEEAGHGIMDIVFGRISPSGRMPTTTVSEEYISSVGPVANFNMITFGIGRTYRYYNYSSPPIYYFGYGLGYGKFQYTNPTANLQTNNSISITVLVQYLGKNTGALARETVQVYVKVPSIAGLVTPITKLCGFTIVELIPGAAPTSVSILIQQTSLYTYASDGSRSVTKGEYVFSISGHAPMDTLGIERASNVVEVNVTI
jgi:beta-glucosidase